MIGTAVQKKAEKCHHNGMTRNRRTASSPRKVLGEWTIYANKPDGITKALLTAKNLSNPVDVSVSTIMRGAKEVLKNGQKALACAKDSESDYKDGSLPSG